MCKEDKAALWKYKLFLRKNSGRSKVRARGQRSRKNACLFFLVEQQKATSHGIGIWILETGFPPGPGGNTGSYAGSYSFCEGSQLTWPVPGMSGRHWDSSEVFTGGRAEPTVACVPAVLWQEDPGSGSLDTLALSLQLLRSLDGRVCAP